MPQLRISDAAQLLDVSDDTVRRWADQGRLQAGVRSARNSLRGIVTRVVRDTVMAQVDVQAGRHRLVSLMSREAADDLALEVGTVVVASVKATNVVVELEAAAHP